MSIIRKGLVKMTFPSHLQYLNDSLSKSLSSLKVYFRIVLPLGFPNMASKYIMFSLITLIFNTALIPFKLWRVILYLLTKVDIGIGCVCIEYT